LFSLRGRLVSSDTGPAPQDQTYFAELRPCDGAATRIDPRTKSDDASAVRGAGMIGIAFGDCRGWYHDAPGTRAVIICSPLGFEELCARQSLRILAEKLAALNLPVLRFDYPGTADSTGSDGDENLVEQWRASLADAQDWLSANTGIREIVLIGMRFGSLLAALEARGVPGLKGLALLAPVTSGRAYLRETTALANIVMPPNAEAAAQPAKRAGEIDVCGFLISPATASRINALKIDDATLPGGLDVLLMPQQVAPAGSLQQRLASAGCKVTTLPFTGYDGVICDPTAAKVPLSDLDAIAAWAKPLASTGQRARSTVEPGSLGTSSWTEAPVSFGPNGRLTGILCTPHTPFSPRQAVVFTNAGMNYHIGWSRMTVAHARALAEQGLASLRYDTSGIGDSLADPDNPVFPLYDKIAEDDVAAAIDRVVAQGYDKPLIFGACSGAYTAFRVTKHDPRVAKAAIVNLQCFQWSPSVGYEIERWRAVRRTEVANMMKAGKRSGLLAQISGSRFTPVGAVRFVGRIAKRALRAWQRSRFWPRENDIVATFRSLAGRKTKVMMIYSRGDKGLDDFEAHAGKLGHRVTGLPGVSLHFIENADHNLTTRASQDDALAMLLAFAHDSAERQKLL
jgi:pimeloyl-ACP methyl ester carboxylesterase